MVFLFFKQHDMKIWQKNIDVDSFVDTFTVGNDRLMDMQLAGADVLGSLAHTRMLNSIGLMTDEDLESVQQELKNIYQEILEGRFQIEDRSYLGDMLLNISDTCSFFPPSLDL